MKRLLASWESLCAASSALRFVDINLRGIGQVMFQDNPLSGALFLAAQGDYGHAIFLTAWGAIVVGMVDNFLRPMLISGRADVPTLAVFVGVMGGLAAFGFIGLFVGPIVLGLLVALFRFESERLDAARGHD